MSVAFDATAPTFPWRQPGGARRWQRPAPVAAAGEAVVTPTHEPMPPTSPFRGVRWSFLYAAFLLYIFVLGCFALYPLRGAMFNYYIYHEALFGRAYWNYIYNNPNDLAAVTMLQLSLVAGLLVTEPRGWVRTAAQVGAGLLPMLILMTQSRAGFIALCVFVLCVLFGPRPNKSIYAEKLGRKAGSKKKVVALVLVAAIVSVAAPTRVSERVGGLRGG